MISIGYGPSCWDQVRVRRTVSSFFAQVIFFNAFPIEYPPQNPVASKLPAKRRLPRSLGAAGITFGLPVLLYFFAFACNDVSGCPAPSLLDPRAFSWEQFKSEIGWPENGVWGLYSTEVTGVVLAYYLFSLILWKVLPAQETYGTKLVQHERPLKYRLNGQ